MVPRRNLKNDLRSGTDSLVSLSNDKEKRRRRIYVMGMMCACGPVCESMRVEIRRQLHKLLRSRFPPLYAFWGWNTGRQGSHQFQ